MRAVIQRVTRAHVNVDGERLATIDRGLLVLLGVARGDTLAAARRLAQRIAQMRLFEDERGRMNHSLIDRGYAALVVSQFTLAVDGASARGRRPSFDAAASPADALPLYEHFVGALRDLAVPTSTGRFGASMQVELVNDVPVTFVVDELDPRTSDA